jgi:DNA-binding transcriptional MerR regulator
MQREETMSLTKSWYTFDEAASKFGITTRQLQLWMERGLVRTEKDRDGMILLNGDDIEQELHLVPSV